MKTLRFLQALALLPACAGSPAPTPAAAPAASSAAPTPTASAAPTGTASAAPTGSSAVGPCRCSWETNAAVAARVCNKGEVAHDGNPCNPGDHTPKVYPMEGPLPPPDLGTA